MELRQLRYLVTVAEEGHFTRAADKLFVSQPALSQQIRQLEEELGSVLLDRAGRRVRPTAAGEVLCQHARRMFQELDEARVALNELEGLQRGSLVVATVQTVSAYLIPRVVARFAATYPAITLRVEEQSASEIESGLQAGIFQLGIGFVPTANEESEAEPLFEEELVLIVTAEHPLAGRTEVMVRELDGVPMVLLSNAFCTRRLWDACARQAGIRSRVLVEMNTIGSILTSVSHTMAPSVLPALALACEQAQGLVGIPLRDPTPQRMVGLLWRRNGYRCAASRAFAETVREVTRSTDVLSGTGPLSMSISIVRGDNPCRKN